MRSSIMMAAIAGVMALPSLALSQQAGTYKARLEPDARNISVCINLDTSLRREHTLTVVSATEATVVGAGGMKAKMTPSGAGIYQNNKVQFGAEQFLIVADLSKTPNVLVVTDNRMGCRWAGELKKQ
ncbi:MAG: hypothetical protein AB7F36_10690 [Reyranellaceae bacterium]